MNAPRVITIVGGGLAGLTLGIGLRQRGVPVTIWEAGSYPRHRVCGEFISGQGLNSLKRLDLLGRLERTGAVVAKSTAFHTGKLSSGLKQLPSPALCISRWSLDAVLAGEFRRLGGELREHERWPSRHLDGDQNEEFIVHASGRRVQALERGVRWLGVKAHARKVQLQADLEMFLSRDCYVGVSWLPGGEVNVCGLFRRRAGDLSPGTTAREWFTRIPHPELHERLTSARFDEHSFCSVGGLSFRPQSAVPSGQCRIGDAVTMIPPLTGNGMSMAFESAEIAIAPLAASSQGEISWRQAQLQVAHDCDARFGRRLRWARWLQTLAFSPVGRPATLRVITHCDWLWRAWFSLTR